MIRRMLKLKIKTGEMRTIMDNSATPYSSQPAGELDSHSTPY
jgi:hypothetical protein